MEALYKIMNLLTEDNQRLENLLVKCGVPADRILKVKEGYLMKYNYCQTTQDSFQYIMDYREHLKELLRVYKKVIGYEW